MTKARPSTHRVVDGKASESTAQAHLDLGQGSHSHSSVNRQWPPYPSNHSPDVPKLGDARHFKTSDPSVAVQPVVYEFSAGPMPLWLALTGKGSRSIARAVHMIAFILA